MKLHELIHSPAITCPPTASLAQVAHLMHLHDVGSVVVLDRSGAITGVVTDRDVALKGFGGGLAGDTMVEKIMATPVSTIGADADIDDAAKAMLDHGVRRLPVIDAAGRLVGVVSFDDLLVFVERESEILRRLVQATTDRSTGGWSGTWD
jgi:CBS domain-containing protein